jgi:hypothetical protein
MEEQQSHIVPNWLLSHGELDPKNVFITPHHGSENLRYADFGRVKPLADGSGSWIANRVVAVPGIEADAKPHRWHLIRAADNKLEAAGLGFAIGSVAALSIIDAPASAFIGGMVGMTVAFAAAILCAQRFR